MKKPRTDLEDEMRLEYDFAKMRGGVRGKHAGETSRVVLVQLDADVAEAFPTAASVNAALRKTMKTDDSKPPPPKRRSTATRRTGARA